MALRLHRLLPKIREAPPVCDFCRGFSTSPVVFSGHSKWATIKHDKAKNDSAKGKERQMLSKEISGATQLWGPDPKYNPRLTLALSNAKRASLPKTIIEAAILRGQGLSTTGQKLESVTIEAMLLGSVAVVIECQTDQKARLLQDIRHLIKDYGGTVTPTTFLFEKKGRVVMEQREGLDADEYLDQAIESGATDIITDDKDRLIVYTEPFETKRVGEAFSKSSGLTIDELGMFWDPNPDTLVEMKDEEQIKDLQDLLSDLREDNSVQDIYLNATEKF
ncbi:hypothetical protein N7495_007706 [Penicillium taxi]|uniref:uncharacterized protein n=1 Tax=Penicillium taxi TaxID=168475 RepID=UPI0025458ACD|nr:uncharacterized protein N7495_007706 [Penicillium taxi]KAJ5887665.1 hypothetical protein N7495_007706 [Penicillium taxi]